MVMDESTFQMFRPDLEHPTADDFAAHPGFADTKILRNTWIPSALNRTLRVFAPLIPSAAMGVLPQLYAATAPAVTGGQYYDPDRLRGSRGYPTVVQPSTTARDPELAKRLWDVTAELVGVSPETGSATSG